jgi:hypothetical protein
MLKVCNKTWEQEKIGTSLICFLKKLHHGGAAAGSRISLHYRRAEKATLIERCAAPRFTSVAI